MEEAIYWFANFNHGGQWSNLYSVLSTSPFRPGPISKGPEKGGSSEIMYQALEQEFGNSGGTNPTPDYPVNEVGASEPFNTHWKMDKEKGGMVKVDEEKWMQDLSKDAEKKGTKGALHKDLGVPEDSQVKKSVS